MNSLTDIIKKVLAFLTGIVLGIFLKKLNKPDEVRRDVAVGTPDSKNQVEVKEVKSKDSIFVSDSATTVKVETAEGTKKVELADGVKRENLQDITSITPEIKIGTTNIDETKKATDLTPEELSETLKNEKIEVINE